MGDDVTLDTVKRLHTRLDCQDEMLRDIKRALVGDPALGHQGLVSRQAQTEEALVQVKAEQDAQGKKLLLWGGMVAGASAVISFIKDKIFN